MTDVELLEQHRDGSESAFADLVRRHLGWVHAMARRRLHDPHQAEDVTQAVFVLLHRKAPHFSADRAVVKWLHQTAWYATETARRSERRRHIHETQAGLVQSRQTDDAQSPEWLELAPLLDQLIERLSQADREAVLLRYFREMSYEQVGAELGISPEAARKRVERAIDKLRRLADRRGLTLSAVALTTQLTAHLKIPPPAGLVATTTTAATATAGSALGAGSGAILHSMSALMAVKLTIITICAAVIVVAAAGGAVWMVQGSSPLVVPAALPAPPLNREIVPPTQSTLSGANAVANGAALSPFSDVRWNGDIAEVLVNGAWYELIGINNLPAGQIIAETEKDFGDPWKQRFSTNLPQILTLMGKPPARTVRLRLRTLDDAKITEDLDVAMTPQNAATNRLQGGGVAAFQAVRWIGSNPQVEVGGVWYGLLAVNDLPADKIVSFSQQIYGSQLFSDGEIAWQKRFEEDFTEVLTRMSQPPGKTVKLELRPLDGKPDLTLENSPMTAANRESILNFHNKTNLP